MCVQYEPAQALVPTLVDFYVKLPVEQSGSRKPQLFEPTQSPLARHIDILYNTSVW